MTRTHIIALQMLFHLHCPSFSHILGKGYEHHSVQVGALWPAGWQLAVIPQLILVLLLVHWLLVHDVHHGGDVQCVHAETDLRDLLVKMIS